MPKINRRFISLLSVLYFPASHSAGACRLAGCYSTLSLSTRILRSPILTRTTRMPHNKPGHNARVMRNAKTTASGMTCPTAYSPRRWRRRAPLAGQRLGEATNPGQRTRRQRCPDTVHLYSQNVGSMGAHMEEIGRIPAHIACWQDTKVTSKNLHSTGTSLKFFGWQSAVHSSPLPPQRRLITGKTTVRDHWKPGASSASGGVAITARGCQPLVQSKPEKNKQLYETRRWAEAFLPIVTTTSHYNTTGIFVGCYYGIAGASADQQLWSQNEKNLEDILSAASEKGRAPYVLCMDANIALDKSDVLSRAIASGRWVIAADSLGVGIDSTCPAYGRDKTWDRMSWAPHCSRIDMILLNQPAMHISSGCRLVRDKAFTQHVGTELKMDIKAFATLGTTWLRPGAFTRCPIEVVDEEEASALATLLADRSSAAFDVAEENRDVEGMWSVANSTAEAWMKCLSEADSRFSPGRGQRPIFRNTRVVAPIRHIQHGAEAPKEKEIGKAIRRLRQYKLKVAHFLNNPACSPDHISDMKKYGRTSGRRTLSCPRFPRPLGPSTGMRIASSCLIRSTWLSTTSRTTSISSAG